MSNSNDSIEMKQCENGSACVHPDGPDLPLSEFYVYPKGTLYTVCKKCHYARTLKARRRRQWDRAKEKAEDQNEALVIKQLRRHGIYATPGKASEFRHVDVVAWGAVRIECKSAQKNDRGAYHFNFSSQRRNGINADLVVLVCVDGDDRTYHIFPARHSAFFSEGAIKFGVQYDPLQTKRINGHGGRLVQSLMNKHQDAWHLVEEVRQRIARDLQEQEFDPKRVGHPLQFKTL